MKKPKEGVQPTDSGLYLENDPWKNKMWPVLQIHTQLARKGIDKENYGKH